MHDVNGLTHLRDTIAGIAQLVEHDLAKVGVASSNLVSRSKFYKKPELRSGFFMRVKRDYISLGCGRTLPWASPDVRRLQ